MPSLSYWFQHVHALTAHVCNGHTAWHLELVHSPRIGGRGGGREEEGEEEGY